MAPVTKRKATVDDFFFYTVSDDDEPAKKKPRSGAVDDNEAAPAQDSDGEELDPDFEFDLDDGYNSEVEDLDMTDILKGHSSVNIDDMVRKKREKREKKAAAPTVENGRREGQEDTNDEEAAALLALDDDDDEVLADDAFGMGAGSDDEEAEKEDGSDKEDADGNGGDEDDEGEDDDAASDNDSVATPVHHPDDDEPLSSGDEDDEDEEERQKQKAFFAPEEKLKPSKLDPSTFQGMGFFSRPILRGITAAGFEKPTPIQAKSIPFGIEGKDVVGQAVTGSGKTAAFLLPVLERLLYRPTKIPATRVVVLTPTRELAMQCYNVAHKLASFTSITSALTVGGTSFKSTEAVLRQRPDIVIATPGRFIDHMRNTPNFAVDKVEILILDEADRMLQDGFEDELKEIVTTLPKSRQTMLFSATMNSSVDQLIRVGLNKPVRIMTDSEKKTAVTLVQEFVRLRPGREEKRMGYLVHLCKTVYTSRVIIFFKEKKNIHRTRIIFGLLGLPCVELHGDLKQAERTGSLESFRRGTVPFLLASDLAARGLDIKGVETVINYETPKNMEDYIHRIGRTARAGRRGVAVTIVTEKDRKFVKAAAKSMAKDVKLKSRAIDPGLADEWYAKAAELEGDVEEVLEEEKEAHELEHAEMQVKRGENLIIHQAEIMSRPRKTWFEAEKKLPPGKRPSEQQVKDSMGKMRDQMKKRGLGKLSNKDMKKLDAKEDRLKGMEIGVSKKKYAEEQKRAKSGKGKLDGVKGGRVTKPARKTGGKPGGKGRGGRK